MAELYKTTKNGKQIFEDLKFIGVGQNLISADNPTTRKLRIEFETEKGTKLSFQLFKDEVQFIKNEIYKWEAESRIN